MKSNKKSVQLSMFADSDQALDALGRKSGLTDREKLLKAHTSGEQECLYKDAAHTCCLKEAISNESSFSETRVIVDKSKCGPSCPYFLINKEV